MSRVSVRQLVSAAKLAGSYGGIKVSALSNAGSLDTLHVLFDQDPGFSAVMKMFFYDPRTQLSERDYAGTGQWTLRAPMLALSNPDSALAFPVGTLLQPQLFVRNTTSKPIDASLIFNWRTDSSIGKATGPSLHLAPYETRRLDVAALQDGKTLPQNGQWTSVTLVTSGLPDEVMAVAASYDQSLRYGAQTPFSDQLAVQWEGGQWQYDAQHDSIITAGNGSSKPTQVAFTIFYNQGAQKYELDQTLQPGDQMWMDIGKLIRESVTDKNGKTLPDDLTSGSYNFRDVSGNRIATLFEGKVIYDKTYGHVTYGCAACCGWGIPYLSYNPITVPITTQVSDGVWASYPCESEIDDVSSTFYSHWSSGSTSIVTVDTYGNHTGVAMGSTTSGTNGNLISNDAHENCPALHRTPSGSVNVTPVITSITPDTVLVGTNNVQLTIDGSRFGTAPTVNLPSGVTSSAQGSTNVQIIVTVSVATSATIGPNSITVTNTTTGLTSNQSAFTLDGPYYMTVVSDQVGKCSGCSTTVSRLVTYQVKNFSNSNVGVIPIGENPVLSAWNCNQSQPGLSSSPCSAGHQTNSGGQFADQWTLNADGYTPTGCGASVDDHWMWCPTGRSIGHLSGYLHTNAISINGVVNPPTSFTLGTVINP